MATKKTDLLQGTLDLLVLKALAPAPATGWVSRTDRTDHEGNFQVKPGSCSPALNGWKKRDGSPPLG